MNFRVTQKRAQPCAIAVLLFALCPPLIGQAPAGSDPSLDELRRGDTAYSAGKFPEALEAFKNADKLGNNACVSCVIRISLAYVSMQKWREAIEAADKALTLSPSDHQRSQAHNLKGRAYFAQIVTAPKMLPLAEQEFRAALQADPTVAINHFSLGVALLKESRDTEGIPELQKFIEMDPHAQEAQLAYQWIAEPGRSRGAFAPDFHLYTENGDEISLANLKGKIVVFDFWATWCPPCRAALPDLKDLVKKYPADRFSLISVSIDRDTDAWREYVEKKKMTWTQYHDIKSEFYRTFGLHEIPTYIVIAGDGSIIDRVEGTDPQQSISYRLKDILAKRPELKPN
jgi:thioredoxin-like negative regulator of GroEL